jgi:uncharacterized protein YecE (DUF72 family)
VKLLVGTSGYAFKEWKGTFYPEDLPDDGQLGYYASQFPTVEINNTFYRLPKEHVLLEWASRVPDHFTFAIKASQRITHHARLKPESKDALDFLLKNTVALGAKLGPILFQCPPNLKKDLPRLQNFLTYLPDGRRFAFEFRHETWFDDEVAEALRGRDAALCISEQDEFAVPVRRTASWGYLRLHRFDYDSAALVRWAEAIRTQSWTDAYIYFKHDEAEEATAAAGGMSGPSAVRAFTELVQR